MPGQRYSFGTIKLAAGARRLRSAGGARPPRAARASARTSNADLRDLQRDRVARSRTRGRRRFRGPAQGSRSTPRECAGGAGGSSSVWRSTSRVTGAVSPSPNTRNFNRYAIGLPSVQPKYACGMMSVVSRRCRAAAPRSRSESPGSGTAEPGIRRPPPLDPQHLAELRRVAGPDLQEQHRLVRRQVMRIARLVQLVLVLGDVALVGAVRDDPDGAEPRGASSMNCRRGRVRLDAAHAKLGRSQHPRDQRGADDRHDEDRRDLQALRAARPCSRWSCRGRSTAMTP